MKKWIAALCIFALLCSLAACGGKTPGNEPGTEPDPAPEAAMRLRLVDGAGTDRLVLAGEGRGDLYVAGPGDLTLYIDGESADVSRLENGVLLDIDPGFTSLETWPAQLKNAIVRVKSAAGENGHGDLCGLYLKVLEDLWADDAGLNNDITYVSVYLDEAPGSLTDGEKAAVTWIFSGRHNAEGLGLDISGLRAGGYMSETELYWKDGVLFRIRQTAGKKSDENKITFDAEKWRSGDGAIFYFKCESKRGEGLSWRDYTPGSYGVA